MSGHYGKVTEHPELPIEDAGRFTVKIRRHPFETDDPRGRPPLDWRPGFLDRDIPCKVCPFGFSHPVHE